MNKKKTVILPLLLFMAVFFFSGCSIRKVEEEKVPETKKQNEIVDIDSDGDGLSDKEEKGLGTNLNNSDTDGDGLNDYDEVKKWETDPNNPDSDGDGYSDGQEVKNGYDPNGSG
jgi:hypothetical protein